MLRVGFFLFPDSSQIVISQVSTALVLEHVCKESLIQINEAIDFLVGLQNLV